MRHGAAVLLVFVSGLAARAADDVGPPADDREARAEWLYFADRLDEALPLLEQLFRERPDDELLAYRIYNTKSDLGVPEEELAAARGTALRLLEAEVGRSADVLATYYLGLLIEGEEPERRDRIFDAVLGRQLPDPDTALGVFALGRLQWIALAAGRPESDRLAVLRAALRAEDGAWKERPYLSDLTSAFHEIGSATGALDELEGVLDDAVRVRPGSIALRLARADFLLDAGRAQEALEDLERAGELDGEIPRNLHEAGRLWLRLERPERALPLLTRAVDAAPHLTNPGQDLGRALFELGRHREAETAWRRALVSGPDSALTRTYLARALAAQDRFDEAEAMYREALAIAPDWSWIRTRFVSFLEDRGRLEEALAILDLAEEPDADPWSAELRARMLWMLDRNDEAVRAADAGLERFPEDPTLQLYRGLALHDRGAEGDLQLAVDALRRSLQQLPRNAEIWERLARMLSSLGRREEAIEAFRRAHELLPDSVRLAEALAVEYQLAGRHEDSMSFLDEALARFPRSAPLHWRRAIALDSLGRPEEALPEAREAARLAPEHASIHNSLGVVLVRLGRVGEAIEVFRRAVALDPSSTAAASALALLLEERGEHAEALHLVERLRQSRPDDPELALRRGRLLARLGRFEDAEEALRPATEAEATAAAAWLVLGDVLRERGRVDEALAAYDHALEDARHADDALRRRLAAMSEGGRLEDGVAWLERRIASGGGGPVEHETLAVFLRDLGRLDEARQAARAAIETRPDHPRPFLLLGDVEARAGDPAAAAEAYARGLAWAPDFRQGWLALAGQREAAGDDGGALAAAERALGLADDLAVRTLLARLAERRGHQRDARRHWEAAVLHAPDDPEVLSEAVGFWERAGRKARARKLRRRLEDVRAVAEGASKTPGTEAAFRRGGPLPPGPIDPAAVLARYDPQHPVHAAADAVLVLHALEVEILPDGRRTETHRGMLEVRSEEAAERCGRIPLPTSGVVTELDLRLARTRLPDGSFVDAGPDALIEEDGRRVLVMQAVRAGSILEWSYTRRQPIALPEEKWAIGWPLDSALPTAVSRLTVRVPRAADFDIRLHRLELRPAIRDEGVRRSYTWTAYDRPALHVEPNGPPNRDREARIELGNFRSWNDLAAWYDRATRDRYRLGVDLARVVDDVEGIEDPTERARRLAREVRLRVREHAETWDTAPLPQEPEVTWQEGRGDSHDRVALLVALLREAGVEAHPAFLRLDSLERLDDLLPSPWTFDYAIVWLPEVDGGIFVDPSMLGGGLGDLMPGVQGVDALVVEHGRAWTTEVPEAPAGANSVRLERRIDVSDPGRARVSERAESSGPFGSSARLRYGDADEHERRRLLEEEVLEDSPMAVDLEIDVSGARDPERPAVVVQRFTVPDLLEPDGEGRYRLALGDNDVLKRMFEGHPSARRRTDFIAPMVMQLRVGHHVVLPEGWEVAEYPPEVDIRVSMGSYRKSARPMPDGWLVESHFELTRRVVPPHEYPELLRLLEAEADNRSWSLGLAAPEGIE